MKDEILRLDKVTRIVDGLTVLDNFNLHVFKQEIMGLICINAQGQKELMELLCKNLPIHYGRIYYNETIINHYMHSSLSNNKISIIEKQNRLVEDLTVADNIFILRQGFKKYIINKNVLNSQLEDYLDQLNIYIDGNELIMNLTAFEKSIVELLKAIVMGVKLIVIKDISNCISSEDLVKFQGFLRYYCQQGFSFIYICNHHEEAFKICDRVSLMEHGRILKVLDKKDFTREKMKPYYRGAYDESHKQKMIEKDKVIGGQNKGILQFQGIQTQHLKNMDFIIEKGECIVLLDVNHTVLTDIIHMMTGDQSVDCGNIFIDGNLFTKKDATKALSQGIGFIDENPSQSMIFREMSYLDNLSFLVEEKQTKIRLNKKIKKSIIREYEPLIGQDIYAKNVSILSTASLYSMVYYRFHLFNPKVLFCLQPFYGADMYLRKHIIKLIRDLKQKGITVIILAVNLSDSLMIADRLMVIKQGCLIGDYGAEDFHLFHNEATLI